MAGLVSVRQAASRMRRPASQVGSLFPKEKSYYPTLQIDWDPERIGLENWNLASVCLTANRVS